MVPDRLGDRRADRRIRSAISRGSRTATSIYPKGCQCEEHRVLDRASVLTVTQPESAGSQTEKLRYENNIPRHRRQTGACVLTERGVDVAW